MPDSTSLPTTADVVIVGGGAAGVAAARHLADTRPDLATVLVEAGPRLGGRARTVRRDPDAMPLDLGCGWLHGARDNAWTAVALARGFVLDDALSSWDGADRDLGLAADEDADANRAIQQFFAAAERRSVIAADLSMAAVLDPAGRWNDFIGAIGTFVNGVELDRASLEDYQRYDPGRGPDRRVRDGYGTLVAAHGADLSVRCGTIVEAITHGGPGVHVDTSRGACAARAAIVTVSTAMVAANSIRFDPALPEKVAAASVLPLGVCNKLFLGIPEDLDLPREHYILGSAYRTRTASYHIGPFGRPVIECYFGGDLARDVERDRAAAVAFAIAELERFFGAAVRRLVPLAASAWAAEPYVGGAYSYAVPGHADARTALAAPVGNRLFFAGEACSRHRYSTAHGAFETGVAAAEAVAAALARR